MTQTIGLSLALTSSTFVQIIHNWLFSMHWSFIIFSASFYLAPPRYSLHSSDHFCFWLVSFSPLILKHRHLTSVKFTPSVLSLTYLFKLSHSSRFDLSTELKLLILSGWFWLPGWHTIATNENSNCIPPLKMTSFFLLLLIASFPIYPNLKLDYLLIAFCPSNLVCLKTSKLHIHNITHIHLFCSISIATTQILTLCNLSLVQLP